MICLVPPLSLNRSPTSLSRFLVACDPCWNEPGPVTLSFTNCDFISAEAASTLACIILKRQAAGLVTKIDWSTVQQAVHAQLGRWEISSLAGGTKYQWTGNAIPILHLKTLDKEGLYRYICTYIQSGQNMPQMSEPLNRQVHNSIFELFLNAFDHSETTCGAFIIGQFYPRVREVQLCICDGGVGLARRVQAHGNHPNDPVSALKWSLQEGTTTRSGDGPPGGLGLFLLKEFIKVNGGNLRILANRAHLSHDGGVESSRILPISFPGTMFELRLKVRDDVTYCLDWEQWS